MLVFILQITRSHIPTDCNIDTDRSEKLEFCLYFIYLSFNNAAKTQVVLRFDRMINE
jgi:hypothetical protein